jgi:hypothetical protein
MTITMFIAISAVTIFAGAALSVLMYTSTDRARVFAANRPEPTLNR